MMKGISECAVVRAEVGSVFRHKDSGKSHKVRAGNYTFVCGRPVSDRYEQGLVDVENACKGCFPPSG
eukprot:11602539-Karenia_brevis.AAC.1